MPIIYEKIVLPTKYARFYFNYANIFNFIIVLANENKSSTE